MLNSVNQIKFTGEFFIPGKSGERIESDHMARYHFACKYVKNKAVLDIACGFGYGAPLMIEAGAIKYDGVDINEKLIDNANLFYGSDCIEYHQGDICSYNSNKLFDIITCFETIEHINNYKIALLNMYRLLKPDGILLISSPNRSVTSPNATCISDKPSNPYHAQEFIIKELKSGLNSAGFLINKNNIFGQRQSLFNIRNTYVNKIIQYLCGNLSIKTSPTVSKIYYKVPRYFIIVADKFGEK